MYNNEDLNVKITIKKINDKDFIHKLLRYNSKYSNKSIVSLTQQKNINYFFKRIENSPIWVLIYHIDGITNQ